MKGVKKLMVEFLAIAVIAGFVTFLFTNPGFYHGTMGNNLFSSGNTTPVPSNAFVPSVEATPLALRENLGGGTPNLTDAAAENVAQVILALNPNGAQQLPDGTTGLIIPTTTILAAYLTMESPTFTLSSLWTPSSSEPVIPANGSSLADNQQYANAFRSIMKNTIDSPSFAASVQDATMNGVENNNFLAAAAATYGQASEQLKATPVPAPFVAFQQSFLSYLDDQQTALAVLANNQVDPLKSFVVLNSGDQVQQQVTGDFVGAIDQYNALDLPSLLADATPTKNSWLDNTLAFANGVAAAFSIPTARAQTVTVSSTQDTTCGQSLISEFNDYSSTIGGIFDVTSDLTNVPVEESKLESINASILKDEAASLGVLLYQCQAADQAAVTKKDATDFLTGAEVGVIQNSGNSRVISDFAQYSEDAATRGALEAYKQDSTQICPQFQAEVNQLVFDPTSTNLNSSSGIDLNSDNISASSTSIGGLGENTSSGFGSSQVNGTGGNNCQVVNSSSSEDFSNDSNAWTDYLMSVTDPADNAFGTLIAAHDDIDGAAAAAAAGAQEEAVANQGYKSQTSCTDSYVDANGNTICDQTQITAPGSLVGSGLQAAINSQYVSVFDSNNPSQMNSQLADSLGVQIQKGIANGAGVVNLLPQTGDSLGSICNSLAAPGTNSGKNPAFLACNSTVGKIINDYDHYVSLVNNIGNMVGSYSQLLGGF